MARAVVIGAGVIGSAIALELQRGGHDVTVVDRGPAAGAGSTSASSAIVRYTYSTRDAILLAWESAQRWFEWGRYLDADPGEALATFVGCANVTLLSDGLDAGAITPWWDEFGVAYEILDAAEVRRRFPALDVGRFFPPKLAADPEFGAPPDGELGALLSPSAGFVDDPRLAAANLADAARRVGAEFRLRTEIVAIERDDGGTRVDAVMLATGERLAAEVVVNAAGPHSSIVNRLAGVTDDMTISHRALRQEVFTVPAPDGMRLEQGGAFVADLDLGQYFRPQPGGTVLIGGTEAECDGLHWIDDPDTSSDRPTVEVWETAMWRFARRVPTFGVPGSPVGLAALYDVSDDWVPIYDRSSLDGFFMACGTSGNQFKNAPMVGTVMRAIIDETIAGRDHDADPVRVVGPHTGAVIDAGAFSRRRRPATTSQTVLG
jgi:glycine/D-amino acid oxidase-like deaminating enzyme